MKRRTLEWSSALAILAGTVSATADTPHMRIFTVAPPEGGVGDLITIIGEGFGTDPEALCCLVILSEDVEGTLEVIEAHDTRILARVQPVGPNALPGRLMLKLGEGAHLRPEPASENILNLTDRNWRWTPGVEHPVESPIDFLLIPDPPPPPGTECFYGEVIDGRLVVTIEGSWTPNTQVRIYGRLRRAPGAAGASAGTFAVDGDVLSADGTFYHSGGSAFDCAQDICAHIESVLEYLGDGPAIKVDCDVVALGDNEAEITITLLDPETCDPVPLSGGAFTVCTETKPAVPFDGFDNFGFWGGEVQVIDDQLVVSNIGASGDDGVTVGATDTIIARLEPPVVLDRPGRAFGAAAWGSFDGRSGTLLGTMRWEHSGDVVKIGADFSGVGADFVRAQVYLDRELVGEVVVPAGTIGTIEGGAEIIACGLGPVSFDTFFDVFTEISVDGGTLEGNELRLIAEDPKGAVDNLQVFDMTGANLGRFTITELTPRRGDACPEDLDDSGAVDFADLLRVLAAWGPYEPCPPFAPEDLDEDCEVGFDEVLMILTEWGPCAGAP